MMAERPAVAKDMDRLKDVVGTWDAESWEVSFGDRQRMQR
jgi:hypothetical protein